MGYKVQGLGFGFWFLGVGFWVESSGFRSTRSRPHTLDSTPETRVQGLGFGVLDFGCEDAGLSCRFCVGVDFLKLTNKYIVSDKGVGLRIWDLLFLGLVGRR